MEPFLSALGRLPIVVVERSAAPGFCLTDLTPQGQSSPLGSLLQGRELVELLSGSDRESLETALRESAASGRPYYVSYLVDGQRVSEFGQWNGRGFEGYLHLRALPDLTGPRKQTDLERKLRVFFESSDTMMFILNQDGSILLDSPRLRQCLGDQVRDLRGQVLLPLLEEAQGKTAAMLLQDALDKAQAGAPQTLELELRGQRHSPDEFHVTVVPIFEEERLQFHFVSCLDVTELNASHDYVRSSEAKLQALFQASTSAKIIVSQEETIVQCNPAALGLLEAEREPQVLGRAISRYLSGPPESMQRGSCEGYLIGLTGRRVHVDITVSPMLLYGTKHFLYEFYNLSAQKQVQQALQLAAETADKANRAKSTFLATISHEIRTPLNGIVGLLHLARHTDDPQMHAQYFSKLERAAQGLSHILSDVLDFSKIESGEIGLEVRDFQLGLVLDELEHLVQGWLEDKPDVRFRIELEPGVPQRLRGDSLRLLQILTNLCSNAVKFTKRGTVQVRARVVAGDAQAALLEFCVQDTGIGMSPAQIQTAFDAFTQADSSTTRIFGGTGLGLYISKRFVELLGGEIEVESQPESGSLFRFTARFALPAPSSFTSKLSGARILVVEESEASRSNIRSVLERLGCLATLQPTAEQALQVGEAEFEIVLLEGRGDQVRELFHWLKSQQQLSAAVFLMLSMQNATEDTQRAFRLGFDGILTRPVSEASLLESVEAARQRQANNTRLGVARLRGRILLVDDNDINQEIGRQILQLLGLEVSLASTGVEALAEMAAHDFDAVLMDLQMPEMDGLTATRKARILGHGLPIIAMTANALRSDREVCLASGMDDYLTKPINPARLAEVLARFLPAEEEIVSTPQPEVDVPQLDGLNCEEGLSRLGGDWPLYRSLLVQFGRRQQHSREELAQALDTRDQPTLLALLHGIRGTAGNLGARALHGRCEKLESQLREHRWEESTADEFKRELDTVIRSCLSLQEVEPEPVGAPRPVDQVKASRLLEQLRADLDVDLSEAFSTLELLEEEMRGTALCEEAEKLKVWLSEFELDKTRSLIDELLTGNSVR